MSARTVVLELAGNDQLARDLVAGGVFVPGETLRYGDEVMLVLRGGGGELEVRATCVYVDAARGSGLQLIGCDAEMKQQIAALAASGDESLATSGSPEPDVDDASDDASDDAVEQPAPGAAGDETTRAAGDDDPDAAGDEQVRKAPPSVHERLRGLTLVQQIKIAQHGEIQERVLLERMYGKAVWEALLRNPRVTGPEVARIARMGSLPRPLVEIIVSNGGWLQIPEVRRALLTNPRLGTDQILRVLRLLPRHELKLAASQTAYPFAVRDAAKRIIRENAGG